MPKARRSARIAVTLPRATLAAAGLGPSRTAQLIRDLRLTPGARVRAAEETTPMADLRHGPRRDRMLAFDRYDDFLDWKRSKASRA